MTSTSEVLGRLAAFVSGDLDQRLHGVRKQLEHESPTLSRLTLQSDQCKGWVRGKAQVTDLPEYVEDTQYPTVQRHRYYYVPLSCYLPDDDVTLWVNHPVVASNATLESVLSYNILLEPSPMMFLELWKMWDSNEHKPFHMLTRGEFQFIIDKRKEVEWLNSQGYVIRMMTFRDPSEVVGIDRKFEQGFIHHVVIQGDRFVLKTVEDFNALIKRIHSLQGEIASSNRTRSLASDDSELIRLLRDAAFQVKSAHGKEAGDLAFQMQSLVRDYLLKRRDV